MTVIGYFAADTHLDVSRSARHPSMTGDSRYAFAQIVTRCVEERVPLWLGGDIFDSVRPDPDTVRFFLEQLNRMHGVRCRVWFVQGDHDRHAVCPWPSLSPAAEHLHHRLIEVGPLRFWGQDFVPRSQAEEAFGQIPETADVLLTHISLSDLRRIGTTHADLAMIPHVKWVLVGDYHVCTVERAVGASGQELLALSPGSTNSRAVNEPLEKYVLRLSIASNGLVWEKVALRSRPQQNFVIQTPEDLETVVSIAPTQATILRAQAAQPLGDLPPLPEELRKPVAWVKFAEDLPDAYPRLAQAFADWFFFPDPQRQEAMTVVDMAAVPAGAWEGLREALGALRPSRDSVYADACRLLDAQMHGCLADEITAVAAGFLDRLLQVSEAA